MNIAPSAAGAKAAFLAKKMNRAVGKRMIFLYDENQTTERKGREQHDDVSPTSLAIIFARL
ncbi:hypothetical protein QT237_09140 [Geobacillus stearothermophilus]|nr:hypothetical protein QT237_09140 [Geobacillus stearothermophilus]